MNRRHLCGGMFLLGLVCFGLVKPARSAEVAPARDSATTEARDRFNRGLALFEQGENAGALAEFKRAYELIPNASVLYNIGLVYAALNRPVESANALQTFLSQPGAAVPAKQKKQAELVLAEQIKRVANLVVVCDQPAMVQVDGVEAGRTPLAQPIRVAGGTHRVAVMATGFLPLSREVTVPGEATETLTFNLVPTESHRSKLLIRSPLPGAEVLVNGKSVGVTPLPTSVAVTPGPTTVELRRSGYRAVSRQVTVEEGGRSELDLSLEEDPATAAERKGRLQIRTSVPGAQAHVDGAAGRPVTDTFSLPSGPHRVRIVRSGFEPAERSVEVTAGHDSELVVVLVPTAETSAADEATAQTRRILGWSLLGSGILTLGAGTIYAALKQGDLNDARTQLNAVAARESDPNDLCYAAGPDFKARGCDLIHSNAQETVDDAKLQRTLGIVGAVVGAGAAGVGSYLLLSTNRREHATGGNPAGAAPQVSVAADSRGCSLVIRGRF